MSKILFIIIFCSCSTLMTSQEFLQLEKAGHLKRTRFYAGDDLKFSFKEDPKVFYTRRILDLDPEAELIFFRDVIVSMDKIYAIKLIGSDEWAKKLSNTLLYFSATWAAYNVIDYLYSNREPEAFHYIIGASTFAGSWLLKWLIKEKKKKIGRKHRLRILDISFSQPIATLSDFEERF